MPPTLTAALAAQLPPDCPPEVLLAPQRQFVRPLLEAALDDATANIRRLEEKRLITREAHAHRSSIQRALESVGDACFESLLNDLDLFIPAEMNAKAALFALTHETRKQWAKAQAKALLQERAEWAEIAPDMRDEMAQDVAEAWHAGLKQRLYERLCMADYDLLVGRMTQAQLYKWLLDDKPGWVVNRYHGRLTPPYLKRLLAQFNPDQWDFITAHVAALPDVTTPQDAIRAARPYRRLAARVDE